MALQFAKNEYAIPRGRVFFNPKNIATDQYTGEIYLGNCPGFAIAIETTKAEHFSSETGLRQKDESILVEVKRTGSITCDNMNAKNVAMYLSGTFGPINQAAGNVTGEALTVIPGRFYQLGASATAPVGVRKVSDVEVKSEDGVTTYAAGSDYMLEADRGILQILEGGTITAGKIAVDYQHAAATWMGVRTGSEGEIKGSLRVASDNATGENRDFFMPEVSLVPSGNLPVIAEGTDFTQMQFDADVLKPANGEAIYVDGVPQLVP